ncbi:hypothetical protein [Bailinhaonella thermotolerans]|uniref:Secreted protein n=1 Tax=Bailinhaonella thermotolerans TaxID=1070861 RepID=A0A3A4AB94_9ACTN|nr:hypothetical protein [Bailinhaonella thermotolerans]RJL26506.1 hypothetical protein D5H75_26350 [Bailinhaonella thermotolerans]
MNTATKLGAYALGLAVVLAGGAGLGKVAGPAPAAEAGVKPHGDGHETTKTGAAVSTQAGHGDGHGGHGTAAGAAKLPGGLQASQDGYTVVPLTRTLKAGEKTDFRFSVIGPDGRGVTQYKTSHDKDLHLIVVRRDLSGFLHVHPEHVGQGVWSVPITLQDAGSYRFFADFIPAGAEEGLTLGGDISAEGSFTAKALPEPSRTYEVDGYEVRLDGDLEPGKTTKLTLTVSKDGKPVTDLQPYLGAYGHLVALRDGDLAYLHVHPDGEPGDGKTPAGPSVTFYAEAPSRGDYRLYLDFKHGDTVRTAEFTARAGAAVQTGTPAETPEPAKTPAHDADGHSH